MNKTPILVAACALLPSLAYAEKVGVVVTGEATVQPQLAAQLERWLHDHGRDVVPGPLEPEAINTLIDCFVLEDLGCARGVVDTRSKSRSVIFTRVETKQNADGTRDIAITGYWFQKDHDAIAERRVCTKCNDTTFHATVDELMLSLVHDPPPPLTSARAAAQPAPGDELVEREPGMLRKNLPYGLIGAGALMVVGGAVLIALDEDTNELGKQEPRYWNSATGGVVLGLAGLGVIAGGVLLWNHDKHSTPVAAVSHDGAYVGWAGRF